MPEGFWVCEWCGHRGEGTEESDKHDAWHMDFLLADGSGAALQVMESPTPFQPLKRGEHDE